MVKALTSLSLKVFAAAVLLAGCNSSSDTTGSAGPIVGFGIENEINESLNVVRIKTDKEEILRFGDVDSNAITSALVKVYSYLRGDAINQFGRFSGGYVEISPDAEAEIFSFLNNDKLKTHIDLITLPSGNQLLEVRGENVSEIPTGLFRYEGTNIFVVAGDREDNEFGSSHSKGTFRMEVNFKDKTGTITAYSDRRRAVGEEEGLDGSYVSGNLVVDSEAGTYTGKGLTVQNLSTEKEYKAVIYGTFHGEGAKGVTGLYVESIEDEETDNSPRFYGAIAGVGDAELEFSASQRFVVENEFNDSVSVVRIKTDKEQVLRFGSIEDNAIRRAIVEVYTYLTSIETNPYGRFSEGTVEVGPDEEARIYSFLDGNTPSTHIDLVTLSNGSKLLEVRGSTPADIPTGVFRYEGTNIFVVVGNRAENEFGSSMSHGTFRMEVNFTDGTGHIEAASASRLPSGAKEGLDGSRLAGNLEVDSETGTFKGEEIDLHNAASEIKFKAVIYGSFHGAEAKGVTGLYVENREDEEGNSDEDPRFYGAFGGVLDTESRTYRIVREIENDYNVVQIRTEDSNLLRYALGTKNAPRRGIVIDYRNRRTVASTDYGSFIEAEAYVGLDGVGNVYSYSDNKDQSLYLDFITLTPDDNIVLNAGTEDLILEVGGDRSFTIPTGPLKYTGTNVFGVWNNRDANGWGSSTSNGTFTMDVNFDNNTGTIDANSPTRSPAGTDSGLDGMHLTGNIQIDSATGTFLGNDLQVENTVTQNDFKARINGTFHGDGAQGVTGLYVEDNPSPRFFGAMAGVKEELRE